MKYELVIGHTEDLVIFKIMENLYAMVGIKGDITYRSNWIYLLRFVQIKKGEPDKAVLEKTSRYLADDDTNVNSLDLHPLAGRLKDAQDEYEAELEFETQ